MSNLPRPNHIQTADRNADTATQITYHRLACVSLIALIILLLSWEWFLAPLRPGGSWLVFKIIPLLFPLGGILRRDNYTMQWSSMLILLYFTEGIVRGVSDIQLLSNLLAWGEVCLSILFFLGTVFYLRPYKKAAKKSKTEVTHIAEIKQK